METAREFWLNADMDKLAEHWKYDQKLPYEVQALIPHLHDSHFIWDAACGNRRVTRAIQAIFRAFTVGTDIKDWDLKNGVFPGAKQADTVLLLGVIQFLTDEELKSLMSDIRGMKVIIRTACGSDEYINKYSDELKVQYEALYRSIKTVRSIMEETHNVKFCGKIYPEFLESQFGTRQYLFVGTPCNGE